MYEGFVFTVVEQMDSHFQLVRLMVGFFVSSLAGRWISQFKVVNDQMYLNDSPKNVYG